MRIGINTLFLIPGEVGGSETYLCETVRALTALAPDEELVLFTNVENHEPLQTAFPRATCRRLNFRAQNRYARIIREQFELPRAAGRAAVDVLWSPGYTGPLRLRCPQVLSILDMQYKAHPEDLTPLARLVTDVLVKGGARRARRIVAISEFAKRSIVQYTGVDVGSIDVTPLAADPAFGVRCSAPALLAVRRLIGSEAPYLLCVANTYPHKNVHALVESFARLASAIPHHLVLVGKPRLGESAVRAALARVADPLRVHRLPWTSRDDLIALYQGADLFVFPSLYEGFGLPVLEAMQAGTPVVTTRRTAIPEVGGECAFYFDPDQERDLDARILAALTMPTAARATWVTRAAERARTFTWQCTADLTLRCLREAAGCR